VPRTGRCRRAGDGPAVRVAQDAARKPRAAAAHAGESLLRACCGRADHAPRRPPRASHAGYRERGSPLKRQGHSTPSRGCERTAPRTRAASAPRWRPRRAVDARKPRAGPSWVVAGALRAKASMSRREERGGSGKPEPRAMDASERATPGGIADASRGRVQARGPRRAAPRQTSGQCRVASRWGSGGEGCAGRPGHGPTTMAELQPRRAARAIRQRGGGAREEREAGLTVGRGRCGGQFRRTAGKKTTRGRRREECASWAREDELGATTGTYRRAPHAEAVADKPPPTPAGRVCRAHAQAAGPRRVGPPCRETSPGRGMCEGGRGGGGGGGGGAAEPAHEGKKGVATAGPRGDEGGEKKRKRFSILNLFSR
jgi:hypothetical protein